MRDNTKIASEPASHLEAHYSLVAGRRQRGTYRRLCVLAFESNQRQKSLPLWLFN
jgi:hypothetical protein